MTHNITAIQVEAIWFPLVKKFYQAYYPSGKPNKADPIWVLKNGATIIAGVRLKPLANCQLLTALVTHPDYRNQGYASQLISELRPHLAQPTYCFNNPNLKGFYEKLGFIVIKDRDLPSELASRLKRYQVKQPSLIAMAYLPHPTS